MSGQKDNGKEPEYLVLAVDKWGNVVGYDFAYDEYDAVDKADMVEANTGEPVFVVKISDLRELVRYADDAGEDG